MATGKSPRHSKGSKPPSRGTTAIARLVGGLLAAILFGLTLLHVYWSIGGRWGLAAALGGETAPPASAVWTVAAMLLLATAIVLARSHAIPLRVNPALLRVLLFGMALAFLAVATVNARAATAVERFGFAPFAALLAVLTIVLIFAPDERA